MERHFLLTVGDEMSSNHGLRFISQFFTDRSEIKVTLLYIAVPLPVRVKPSGPGKAVMDSSLHGQRAQKGNAELAKSRHFLIDQGFLEANIFSKLADKRFGTVQDIIHEACRGHYDAAVLGRRGYAVFEQLLATSVTREILEQEIDFPLWICRMPAEGRRHVLLCVDETEPSLRIADHVGFILGQEKGHGVTLFHVDTGEMKNVQRVFDLPKEQLLRNGVSTERITTRLIRAPRIARTILEEAERGEYAVVAMGHGSKEPQGIFQKWLVGSMSMKLLEELEKAVLWVSR
ncbi:MAG: universal stress protein [Desulfobacteraceae bacterium]|nr:universal stress protein [Desulfobacteraceae bacterium]